MSADLGPSAHTSILHRRTLQKRMFHLQRASASADLRQHYPPRLRGLDSGSEAGLTERKGRDEGVLGVGA